jgi:thiamine biosynthesis lipoprotein
MTTADLAHASTSTAEWSAIGVTVQLAVTDGDLLPAARALVEDEIAALDLACSRFRPDSELVRLSDPAAGRERAAAGRERATAGRDVPVSALLAEAISVALAAAEATGGAVDPTLGTALTDLGYHRDFATLDADGPAVRVRLVDPGAWRRVRLDAVAGTVAVPDGVRLDLGATAKALGADRAAARVHAELGTGVLVSLGGDLAVAGPAPDGGWPVRVQDRPGSLQLVPDGPVQTIALQSGGLATSGTAARRWTRGGRWLHHLLDPRTGLPVATPWRTVSVAAASCVQANTATTATMVMAGDGLDWLAATGLPARLVAADGTVTRLAGWPES